MKKANSQAAPFMGSVKVGPKGQIVIPKEVREMFGVEPGDTLFLLAHPQKGIARERPSLFAKLTDAIFAGHADAQLHEEPVETEVPPEVFAKKLQTVLSELEEPNDKP